MERGREMKERLTHNTNCSPKTSTDRNKNQAGHEKETPLTSQDLGYVEMSWDGKSHKWKRGQ
jgi:hypothetical protein